LANVLGDQPDRLAEAFEAAQKGHEIDKRLVAENPDSGEYLSNLAIGYANIGNGYLIDWGRDEEAIECWEKSQELLSLLIDRSHSANSSTIRHSALRRSVRSWLCTVLATCPDTSKRNPDRALQLAEAEHRFQPGSVSRLMLATALIAKGQWQAALERLKDLETFSGNPETFEQLILMSIALHRMGKRVEAQQCHSEANTWLKDNHEAANRHKFIRAFIKRLQSYYDEMVNQPED
jgi:tetratricopeptide (TPR) repeat protein